MFVVAAPLAIVALVLFALVDDRHVGRSADERQVIWAAVALCETGQLAQARGHDFAYVGRNGEAVSRYGIGMTLLQVPAACVAPALEARLGPGSSQPLFLLAPIGLVLLAAGLAGRAAFRLSGRQSASAAAILLCGVGSPLASYAATSFSEPLQAVTIAGAYACALGATLADRRAAALRLSVWAGVFAGCGLLAKSSLVIVTPAALLPLLATSSQASRRDRLTLAALGFLPGLAIWLPFELLRFGRVFASYPGEGFTHPFLDGLWRLLVSPTTGFLLFFPAAVLPIVVLARWLVARQYDRALHLGGAVMPFVILLVLSAGWWAWHGIWGWGPRLLVPAVPPVAAAAAAVVARRRSTTAALVLLCVVVNLPGLMQHPIPVTHYIVNLRWPVASAGVAHSLAGYAVQRDSDGTYHISPDQVLATLPQASPFLVYPWFWNATRPDDASRVGRALQSPPWARARPDLVPHPDNTASKAWVRSITGPPRARFWGRGFWPSREDAEYAAVFDEGLADQVIRLQQRHDGAGALALARRLVALAPIGDNEALVMESYRLLGDGTGAVTYLHQLPLDRRAAPAINVVIALFERDEGKEEGARRALESVADLFPKDAPLQRARLAPLSEWPPDLQGMLEAPVKLAGEQ